MAILTPPIAAGNSDDVFLIVEAIDTFICHIRENYQKAISPPSDY